MSFGQIYHCNSAKHGLFGNITTKVGTSLKRDFAFNMMAESSLKFDFLKKY
jgi:hypothetical protein